MIENIDLNTKPKLAKKARLQYDSVRSQNLLLLPERIVKLNKTASDILELCDGNRRIEDITAELEIRYKQNGLQADVIEFVRDLSERGWVD